MEIKVDQEVVSKQECERHIREFRQRFPDDDANTLKSRVAKEILKHVLLKNQARKDFPDIPAPQLEQAVKAFKQQHGGDQQFSQMCQMSGTKEADVIAEVEDNLRIQMFVGQLTRLVAPPPEKIMREYYERDPEISMAPVQIRGAHIVKSLNQGNPHQVYEQMCEIRQQLLDGADFAKTADEQSSCTDSGGDLGTFSPGQMVEEFDTMMFSMEEGEISPVFQTPFGLHIATVYEKKPARRLDYDECADAIRDTIMGKLRDQKVDEWIETAKSKATIEVSD